jgi:hypothetical protein
MPKKWTAISACPFCRCPRSPASFLEYGGLVYPESRRAAAFTYAKATPKKSADKTKRRANVGAGLQPGPPRAGPAPRLPRQVLQCHCTHPKGV